MKDWQSQAHVKWECKYHVVIIPKYRKKVLYGKIRVQVGKILRDLCRQKGVGHDLFCTVPLLHEESFPAYGRVDSLIIPGSGFQEGVK